MSNQLHIVIHGRPGAGKSTLLRRLSAHAQTLGIDIVSVNDGEQSMGVPARMLVTLTGPASAPEMPDSGTERFAVCTPDGQITALAPEDTLDDAMDCLDLFVRDADAHNDADSVDGIHLAKVRVNIIEAFPPVKALADDTIVGSA